MNLGNPKLVELTQKYQLLIERIRSESDIDERKVQSEKLKEVMEAMFAVDLEQRLAEFDQQSAALKEQQASLESRRTQREQIIKTGLERVLAATDEKIVQAKPEKTTSVAPHHDDLFAFPIRTSVDVQLQVVSDRTEKGMRLMKVHAVRLKPENRTREVPFTNEVEQTHKEVIDGKQIQWTVTVPEQRTKTEVYQVQVPTWQILEIEVPQGEDWQEIATKKLTRDSKRR